MTMKRLPKEHLTPDLRVKDLKTGEFGWTHILGIAVGAEGTVYVNPETTTTQSPEHGIRVTRTEDGLTVSISKACLPTAVWRVPPCQWETAVQVEVHDEDKDWT